MYFRLKFLLSENEKRTSVCWWNTLLIATRGKRVKTLRPSTRRPSDCWSRTLGPETYANYRTSSNGLSSCLKQRLFRWTRAGCPNSRRTGKRRASFISPRRWQLKKRKSSKQLCEHAKDGYSDRRAQPPSSESRVPHWNRKFGHSRLTRIASRLSREFENSRLSSA